MTKLLAKAFEEASKLPETEQDVLARVEVMPLDALLRLLDRTAHHAVLERRAPPPPHYPNR